MQTPAPKIHTGDNLMEATKSVEGRKAVEIEGLKYIRAILIKKSLLSGPVRWCNSTWVEGNPGYLNTALCNSCKNHLLHIGGGKCWELGYEETD